MVVNDSETESEEAADEIDLPERVILQNDTPATESNDNKWLDKPNGGALAYILFISFPLECIAQMSALFIITFYFSTIDIQTIALAILLVYAMTTGYIYIEYVQFLILRQRLLSDRLLAFTLEHLLTNSEVLGFIWPLYFAYLMEKAEEEYLQNYIISSGDSTWSRLNYSVAFLQIIFHYLFYRRR